MKPVNFPGRKQNRQFEAACRKQVRTSYVKGSKEESATVAAIAAGPYRGAGKYAL